MCMSTVFFFKQKTTYEMRISDWSSDVCSSELGLGARLDPEIVGKRAEAIAGAVPRDDAIAGARQRTDLAAPIFLRAERAVQQEDGDPARAGHAVIGEPRHAARSPLSAPPTPGAPELGTGAGQERGGAEEE